jgi:SnoaL-like domain
MNESASIAERYIDSFNETDPDRRGQLIEDLYAEDCAYTDPNVELFGREQLAAFIAGTQARFPGHRFSLAGRVDAHHDQARLTWHAYPPSASEPEYVGFDVISASGRIKRVYGFIGLFVI